MKKMMIVLMLVLFVGGCTLVTQDQKDWVADKANRSEAYVALMEAGETVAAQDKAWIRGQNESWRLWAAKVKLGLAAPSFLVRQPTTQPAGKAGE